MSSYDVIIAVGGDFCLFSMGSTVPQLLVSTAHLRVVLGSELKGRNETCEVYR